MIAWQHLFWIIPLSMIVGACTVVCIACIIIGKESEEEELKLFNQMKEQENDNRNA